MQRPQKWPKNAERVWWLGSGISLPASLQHWTWSTNFVTIQARGVFVWTHNSQWERLEEWGANGSCAIYEVRPGWLNGWICWYCSHRLFIASIQPGACCVCAFVEQCCSLNCVSLYWIPRQKSYRVNMLRGMHDGTKTTPVRPRRTMFAFICSYDCLWVKPLLSINMCSLTGKF